MKNLKSFRYIFAVAVFALASQAVAWGAIFTWNGGNGSWETPGNWTLMSGTDEGVAGIPDGLDSANFFQSGFEATPTVNIQINTDITVASLNTPNPNYQDDPFTLTFTGTGSLFVTNSMEFFRPSSDPDSDIATIVFNIDTVCNGSVTMHSGTTLSVPATRTFSAVTIQQTASGSTPPTKLEIGGSITATTINLATIADVTGMMLDVLLGGTVQAGTLTRTGSASAIESRNLGAVNLETASTNITWTAGSIPEVVTATTVKTWDATKGDTNWHLSTNWIPAGIPDSTHNVVIESGETQPVIKTTLTASANTVTIDSGATLTMTSTLPWLRSAD